MHKPPDLLGSRDTCTLLRIDRSTLSRWVSAGKLTPALRLGGESGAYLFSAADVKRLAQQREQATP